MLYIKYLTDGGFNAKPVKLNSLEQVATPFLSVANASSNPRYRIVEALMDING